ncbi:uncharacterized protein LOC123314915 [Coccinella septempunctata]|uniref:uncharacterized protein LOC123314915 n=1 Tax=Coccinella septempunctata TaxID=41139 RepID=UPI001D08A7F9|nr:uncharacterized protein LOC123314915 [Coccinella septempunctata]
MSRSILNALTVFALMSLSQASFKNDLEIFLTPWMNAAAGTLPLVRLIVNEIWFLQRDIMGLESEVLGPIYQNCDQKLITIEGRLTSEDSKNCIRGLRSILKLSTDKYQSDGFCFKLQQEKAERIVIPLFHSMFPTYPTPACPIPLLCKIDMYNFSPKNIREMMSVFKHLHKNFVNLIKFLVYFKKEIIACRRNSESYNALTTTILEVAPVCQKL